MPNEFTSWHVAVAAEAVAASLFARCGYDVSVQYGANQPEYDLIVAEGERLLKVSVNNKSGRGQIKSGRGQVLTLTIGGVDYEDYH